MLKVRSNSKKETIQNSLIIFLFFELQILDEAGNAAFGNLSLSLPPTFFLTHFSLKLKEVCFNSSVISHWFCRSCPFKKLVPIFTKKRMKKKQILEKVYVFLFGCVPPRKRLLGTPVVARWRS